MIERVLFLDFDGVLNCKRCRTNDDIIHPGHVNQLNRVIDKTGAKVVISSTWRLFSSPLELFTLLKEKGYGYEILDITPELFGKLRGDEIKFWLSKNPAKSFAIIDDDHDMGSILHRLVKTNDDTGLCEKDANKLISMFENES